MQPRAIHANVTHVSQGVQLMQPRAIDANVAHVSRDVQLMQPRAIDANRAKVTHVFQGGNSNTMPASASLFNLIPTCGFLSYLKSPSSSSNDKPLLGRRSTSRRRRRSINAAAAPKFNLAQVMGGRGLCNGEKGLQLELQKTPPTQLLGSSSPSTSITSYDNEAAAAAAALPQNAFEKELMGLTGGFPGGEKGLTNFIQSTKSMSKSNWAPQLTNAKPNPPPLPLLMPGMTAIVKNPTNPFYMYCGIIQRITDGKAGLLFEGGNWDKLITFRLDELERRDRGPPMVNPKSAVLESPPLIQKDA
ncbi:hypothetical protein Scep_003038 [Stephania cephalantha]|uniref:Chlororespiratory reduction31 n=1 Tax=Stephania cephalantha TaxID=152367 RepID=A0AAP0LB14_9MAGN